MKRLKIRTILLLLYLFSVFLVLSACNSSSSSSTDGDSSKDTSNGDSGEQKEEIVLRVGHPGGDGNSYNQAAKGFGEELAEMTDGRVTMEVYSANQLGDDRSAIEQVQVGTLEMVMTSTTSFEPFVPELAAVTLPFLFENAKQAREALAGEAGDILNGHIEDVGLKNLGWYENGMSMMTTTKREIRSPEDLKGLNIRTNTADISSYVYNNIFNASATDVAFAEIYTSLQQGVVDGTDVGWAPYGSAKLHEVAKHTTELPLHYEPALFVINKDMFDSFDPELQDIMLELGEKWALKEHEIVEEIKEQNKQTALDNGIQLIEVDEIDLAEWQEAVQPVYEEYTEYADIIEAIENTLN